MKVISEDDVNINEALKLLSERKNEKDLGYEQKICLEYLEKIPKVSEAKLKDFLDELGKIVILKPRYLTLIVNILPDSEDEVEALFSKERTNLKKEEIKKIVEIVKKYKK